MSSARSRRPPLVREGRRDRAPETGPEPAVGAREADALLRFLPRFEQPGRRFFEPAGCRTLADGTLLAPSPAYCEDVLAFFTEAGRRCWSDFGYRPRDAARKLADDAFIARCSLADLKTMLTYCVRGERFVDGHWGEVLASGRVVALLRRLRALRPGLPGA